MEDIKKINEGIEILSSTCKKNQACYECPLFIEKGYISCELNKQPYEWKKLQEGVEV